MADHTQTKHFAAFVNVEAKNKFWVNQHWVWDDDSPGLFRYDSKEDKQRVADVAQSYLDHWNMEKIELVVMEIKSRKEMTITKNINAEEELIAENHTKIERKKKEKHEEMKTPDDMLLSAIVSDIPAKKKRGRPRLDATMNV